MKILFAILFSVLFIMSFENWAMAQPVEAISWPPISKSNYDSNHYQFSSAEYQHGEVSIHVAHLKKISNDVEEPPFACRAWLQVVKRNKVIWKAYFDDIDSVGFSYGLFIPHEQPSKDLFAIVKLGDYDGHLYLIKQDGSVLDTLGGFYFLSRNRQYLLSEYSSDASGVSVVDLNKGAIEFTSKELPYIQQWYESGSDYWFTESEWLPANQGTPTENLGNAYVVDINNKKIVQKQMDATFQQNMKKVTFAFDPRTFPDCVTNR